MDSGVIEGELILPDDAKSIVLFSHIPGNNRFSPRNNFVAKRFNENQIGTFLFDLLSPEEDKDIRNRFDINLLTKRLMLVTDWICSYAPTKDLAIGYFGASTGAASAMMAASKLGDKISAVVSRGGRPDLAMPYLQNVVSPSLLLVGSLDPEIITLNSKALARLQCEKKLQIIEGASHLFEEPGKLTEIANVAASWFDKYLNKKAVYSLQLNPVI